MRRSCVSLQHTVQYRLIQLRNLSDYKTMDTTLGRHSPNAVLMLDQRQRRRPNIEPTLEESTLFEGKPPYHSVWSAVSRSPRKYSKLVCKSNKQLRARAKSLKLWSNY